ncbi:MAG: hypothetical protein CR997_04195 [Acidobacteria bacterium]|nr:MAG: hypothetical protein CR997_04195 [Acidobacteriota bacterium]
MKMKRIFFKNSYQNYATVFSCQQSGEAVVIDPFRAGEVAHYLQTSGLTLKAVINTHRHADHTGGNRALLESWKCQVWAHPDADAPGQTHAIQDGNALYFGATMVFKPKYTPGHTICSLCLEVNDTYLITGDTLFHLGCGNCKNGGDVNTLFHSFKNVLASMPGHLVVLPGHDYRAANARFLKSLSMATGNDSTQEESILLSQERKRNPFLYLSDPKSDKYSREKFLEMRALRDTW